MKILNHPAATALGTATLCLLFVVGPLISPGQTMVYHLEGTASSVFIPVIFDVCLLWFSLTILLMLAKGHARLHTFLWSAIILLLPWLVLRNCARVTNWAVPHWLSVSIFFIPSVLFLGTIFLSESSLHATFARVQSFFASLLAFCSMLGLVILAQLVWSLWCARELNPAATLHSWQVESATNAPRNRVVWIILDELSYQQVYGHRFPGIQLPAFDQLAREATVFSHVVPAAMFTEIAVPSLFTGVSADRIRVSDQGQLQALHDPQTGAWKRFESQDTIFQDALREGYHTGVIGWYNPYCRILPHVLDRCFWAFRTSLAGGMSSDQSMSSNLFSPIRQLPSYVLFSIRRIPIFSQHVRSRDAVHNAQLHIDDYRDLCVDADKLLADPSVDFIFLHVAVPHPGGIYDRQHMRYTTDPSSYLDNLVLADQYLAHVRLVLERQRQWDSSTVIVMGDHSWRTKPVWSKQPDWTEEEEEASDGGRFDDRPAYIVKLPNQRGGARIEARFAAVNTRSLLDTIIANRIHTADELKTWVLLQH